MQYLADPVVNTDKSIRDAIAQLTANETIDDATAAALETLVKAKDAAHDQAIAQLVARVDAIPTQTVAVQEASITPIFDPLNPPKLLVPATAMNGATVVSGATGSVMVNEGKVHSFGRTSSPPAPNTWSGNLTIAPTTGACKLRFGITSALPGTIEVSINGATPLTASNIGFGWSGGSAEVQTFIDGGYSWFEIAIAQSASPISVAIKIPTGRGLLPTIYAPDAITSLIPSEPTGLKLSDPRSGKEMIYKPSLFAKPSDIPAPTPPFNSAPLTTRIDDLEYGLNFVSSGVVAFSSEMNISTQLNAVHPNGGLYKEFVTQNEGRAIDITLGSNVTAATLKTELEAPTTDTVIRIKAGQADAIIANASLIPAGLYRLWRAGGQIRLRVLDS